MVAANIKRSLHWLRACADHNVKDAPAEEAEPCSDDESIYRGNCSGAEEEEEGEQEEEGGASDSEADSDAGEMDGGPCGGGGGVAEAAPAAAAPRPPPAAAAAASPAALAASEVEPKAEEQPYVDMALGGDYDGSAVLSNWDEY